MRWGEGEWGGDISLHSGLGGLESVVAPSAGFVAEPRLKKKTIFVNFLSEKPSLLIEFYYVLLNAALLSYLSDVNMNTG